MQELQFYAVVIMVVACAAFLLYHAIDWLCEIQDGATRRSLERIRAEFVKKKSARAGVPGKPAGAVEIRNVERFGFEGEYENAATVQGHETGDYPSARSVYLLDFDFGPITFDGVPVTLDELASKFIAAKTPVSAMLYPDSYGVVTAADFTTRAEAG